LVALRELRRLSCAAWPAVPALRRLRCAAWLALLALLALLCVSCVARAQSYGRWRAFCVRFCACISLRCFYAGRGASSRLSFRVWF
jgi:hypothetical protein